MHEDGFSNGFESHFDFFLIQDSASRKQGALQSPLETVEKIAQKRGLAPEEIQNLLNIALSAKLAVSWLCARKCSSDFQMLILKWIIVTFDFIDQKENMNALYSFFFRFLQYEKLGEICRRLEIRRKERGEILAYQADLAKKSKDLLGSVPIVTKTERLQTVEKFRQLHQFLEEEEEKRLLNHVEEVEKEIAGRRDEQLARLCRKLSSLERIIQVMEERVSSQRVNCCR
ncbi:finger RFP-like [Podarcis lilfordi]|uniref:Finger RFP-like n=1 Tax=Podarcis lilfordi TaxID=74358 RepID=A0AA35LN74_9SAUR|nr:finger RFP-like [Podarcis lilfordi]